MDLDNIIKKLGKEKPIFHSEADFQLSLFRFLCEEYKESPEIDIFLESKETLLNKETINRDISITKSDQTQTVIELKYAPTVVDFEYQGEYYHLKKQNKGNIRYSFWVDVKKLKNFVNEKKVDGYVIFLTNNEIYWKEEPKEYANQDKEYQTFEGRSIKEGELRLPSSDKKKRPVVLPYGKYGPLKWKEYSSHLKEHSSHLKGYSPHLKDYLFKFLLLKINAD